MDHTHHICKSEEDTKKVAELIAPQLKPGMVIFLKGELGAGKTTLVRYLLKSLGYQDKVKSPTYNLVETHQLKNLTVHHFDLYRFGCPEEWFSGGFDDYLITENTISIIEWPEKIKGVNIKPDIEINISTEQFDVRVMDVYSKEEAGDAFI